MANYAKVESDIVTNVIVSDATHIASQPGTWVQTCYLTRGGVHIEGGTPMRKNFAAVGYTYDSTNDRFVPPKPKDRDGVDCDSWSVSATTGLWEPPSASPTPSAGKVYLWDEGDEAWYEHDMVPA